MLEQISQDLVEEVLPHRGRALLINHQDAVVYYPEDSGNPNKLIVYKYVAIDDPVFEGHFPAKPLYRGVDLIECCAQAAIVLAYMSFFKNSPLKGLPVFRGITGPVEFIRPIGPGENIEIEVENITTVKELRHIFYVFNSKVFKTNAVDKSRGKLSAIVKGITGTIISNPERT
jgi:3-hydroxyacyl-[acyl-carrier-protein] dehydratase